jgi:hypothetical protein
MAPATVVAAFFDVTGRSAHANPGDAHVLLSGTRAANSAATVVAAFLDVTGRSAHANPSDAYVLLSGTRAAVSTATIITALLGDARGDALRLPVVQFVRL